ncbi:hypothetical protein BK662_12880 [Pseudomonas frederiksbergensis]|uniref:Uncharacterized protein n=1 Tax=Pseudomonas frederiksbergensis TaxID=104087 RepID=A0A423HQZ7_9PSED|nr:hypothetical protein BK662_12880 [Pseudomonas frederiksbergensis]
MTNEAPLWKCIRQKYTLLTAFLAHASLDSTANQIAVVDLVFEHWELSRENMEIFIAPQGIKADALVDLPPNSHSEHLS